MATKFYLQSSGTPAASPALSASWNNYFSGTTRIFPTSTIRTSTTMTTFTDATANFYRAVAQWVSEPLAAQTITGSIAWVARCCTSSTTGSHFLIVEGRVVSNDGSVVRGTFWAPTTSSSGAWVENGTLTSRQAQPATAVTNVDAQAGDRIVWAMGYEAGATASNTKSISIGTSSATDLTLVDGTTTANNPFIQLSMDVVFQTGGVPNQLMLVGVGT